MSTPDQPTSADVPTCPAHPGVVSYVRCVRCSRPMCSQCQRQAPVGIQCVDCVRAAARTAPQARTSMGAPVSAGSGTPVTIALIAVSVVVYLAQLVVPGLTEALGFYPITGDTAPWTFLTAAFLHQGTTHILFNMVALWFVGQGLERALGWARYLALYLVSALGGSVGFLLFARATSVMTPLSWWEVPWNQGTVGASGAVFGLFGAVLLLAARMGVDLRNMLFWLGLNAVIGFVVPGIAWQAHLGGLLTGLAVAGLLLLTRDRTRARWQWPAISAVAVLLVLLAVVKYATAPAVAGWVQ